ncbi:MAG: DUF4258 domain-containing protein [Rhodobacterales bacterium]|nr:DUF4258 domain-containing protein [Rhodobacterales bacterium]
MHNTLFVLFAFGCVATDVTPEADVPSQPIEVAAPKATPATTDAIVAQMRTQPIRTSNHGKCRMECRKISEAEVEAILMKDGRRDPSRSRTEEGKCPSHALEGKSLDGPEVRIVFAACDDVTLVVTTIDLDTDWPCDCP